MSKYECQNYITAILGHGKAAIDKSLELGKISKRNDPYFSLSISRNEILFLFSIFRIFNILENILFLFLIFELMKKYFSFSFRFMRFQSIFPFLLSLEMKNLREKNSISRVQSGWIWGKKSGLKQKVKVI